MQARLPPLRISCEPGLSPLWRREGRNYPTPHKVILIRYQNALSIVKTFLFLFDDLAEPELVQLPGCRDTLLSPATELVVAVEKLFHLPYHLSFSGRTICMERLVQHSIRESVLFPAEPFTHVESPLQVNDPLAHLEQVARISKALNPCRRGE